MQLTRSTIAAGGSTAAALYTTTSKGLSLTIAWATTLLVSQLPDIVFKELIGNLPAWLYGAKIGLIVALLLVSISWKRLRALWLFFAVLLAMDTSDATPYQISLIVAASLLLLAVLAIAGGRSLVDRDALLLSGVMINAFCSAVIMFLVSLTQDSRLHSIMFWLMGDLSLAGIKEAGILTAMVLPCLNENIFNIEITIILIILIDKQFINPYNR